MSKLLTISIPTYNRAGMLLQQLNWLAQEVAIFQDDCNIVVQDNCSTDETLETVQAWQANLKWKIDFTYYRQPTNIGGMANIESCLRRATGKFVWTLGDDDPVKEGAVSDILNFIKTYPDLGLILLNGQGRDAKSGEIKVKEWFRETADTPGPVNANKFNNFLARHPGGILFISAAVYRTDLVQRALTAWPESRHNLAAQAFWVAYCAARGSFVVTSRLYTECAMGIGFTDKDPKWTFRMRYIDFPEVYNKLMDHGYDKRFCLGRVIQNVWCKKGVKILLGSCRRWPLLATTGGLLYLRSFVKATTFYLFKKNTASNYRLIQPGTETVRTKPVVVNRV